MLHLTSLILKAVLSDRAHFVFQRAIVTLAQDLVAILLLDPDIRSLVITLCDDNVDEVCRRGIIVCDWRPGKDIVRDRGPSQDW